MGKAHIDAFSSKRKKAPYLEWYGAFSNLHCL